MLNSGCNDLSKINADDVVYEVKSSNPQDMEAFLHRLNRYPSSLFSDVLYDEQKSELVFRRGMPDTKTVQYMSKTLGYLQSMQRKIQPALYQINTLIWQMCRYEITILSYSSN